MVSDDFHTGQTIQFQGSDLELKSESRVLFQLDGEIVGHLPATFGVMKKALSVIVP
jgi:diacylglycerol kinase family enzyme